MDFMGLFSLHNKIHPMSLPFPWSTFIPYSHIRSPKGLERQRSVNNRRERIWPGRDTTVRFFSSHSFMVIMSCLFPLPPLTFGSRCSRTKWTVREREWRECRGWWRENGDPKDIGVFWRILRVSLTILTPPLSPNPQTHNRSRSSLLLFPSFTSSLRVRGQHKSDEHSDKERIISVSYTVCFSYNPRVTTKEPRVRWRNRRPHGYITRETGVFQLYLKCHNNSYK